MKYILTKQLDEDDVHVLNCIGCQTIIVHTEGNRWVLSIGAADTRWCDFRSGAYVVRVNDRAIFIEPSERDITFLTLKYGDDFAPLNTKSYFKELQNVVDCRTSM